MQKNARTLVSYPKNNLFSDENGAICFLMPQITQQFLH